MGHVLSNVQTARNVKTVFVLKNAIKTNAKNVIKQDNVSVHVKIFFAKSALMDRVLVNALFANNALMEYVKRNAAKPLVYYALVVDV